MKCLIFGGGGFLGLNLAKGLHAVGHEVRIFDRAAAILRLRGAGYPGFEWVEGDFCNIDDVSNAMTGCDAVFHLVSTTLPKSSNLNPVYDLETNVVGTLRMLDVAKQMGVKKVLFASSGGTVYGTPLEVPIKETHPTDPSCSYGIGKLAIEKYLRLYYELYGLDYCILRISNPYGEEQRPGQQGVVAAFLARALENQPIEIWGDGNVVRDFIYVGDVTEAFVKALHYQGEQRLFNIGAGMGRSLNELLDAIDALIGKPLQRNYLPGRKFDVPVNVLDTSRAREMLAWQPRTSLQEGLARTLAWQQTVGLR